MPADAATTRTLACPACGGTLGLRAAGLSVTIACEYCASLIDVAHPDVQIITRYNETQASLAIPLGTRGTLRGVEWDVIGWMQRSDGWAEWEDCLPKSAATVFEGPRESDESLSSDIESV